MAFDFPDSPTPGQTFYDPASGSRYTFSSGVWKQVASSPVLKGTTSDTPLSNPDPGQLWWESDTGRMFIYYNDGNSSQWVQISGPLKGGSGDWELVQEQNLNAAVNFAFDYFTGWPDQYDEFEITLDNMAAAAGPGYLFTRAKTGNPGVVQTGSSNYGWTFFLSGYGGTGAGAGSTDSVSSTNNLSSLIALCRFNTWQAATGALPGANRWKINFPNPTKQATAGVYTVLMWEGHIYEQTTALVRMQGAGFFASITPITGLHFGDNVAGGLVSGRARLWGRRI